jgi:hypothetical protein
MSRAMQPTVGSATRWRWREEGQKRQCRIQSTASACERKVSAFFSSLTKIILRLQLSDCNISDSRLVDITATQLRGNPIIIVEFSVDHGICARFVVIGSVATAFACLL